MSLPQPLFPLMWIPLFPCPDLLRHPTIPTPMHGINPRSCFGTEWWDVVRHQAYAKYDYRCWACGKGKTKLEGHENYRFDYKAGIAEFIGVVALCNYCHSFIHSGRLEILAKERKISRQKKSAIMRHGRAVLGVSRKPAQYRGPIAAAPYWRLVVVTRRGPVAVYARDLFLAHRSE